MSLYQRITFYVKITQSDELHNTYSLHFTIKLYNYDADKQIRLITSTIIYNYI